MYCVLAYNSLVNYWQVEVVWIVANETCQKLAKQMASIWFVANSQIVVNLHWLWLIGLVPKFSSMTSQSNWINLCHNSIKTSTIMPSDWRCHNDRTLTGRLDACILFMKKLEAQFTARKKNRGKNTWDLLPPSAKECTFVVFQENSALS